ncbi:hypothetical protein PN836_011335 [Ningiella sp. W23]|uniref:hypothetical protein n=1 Tax=Ningiella sp. W23 TaxID=3023715 RepID=UPI003757394B
MEQELVAALNGKKPDSFMKEQTYDYQSIFLAKVFPDQTNPRFFPAVIISDDDSKDLISRRITKKQLSRIYDAENKVMIGKSCIINCCKYDSVEWRKANKSIASIIELGENIAVSEIIQAPTIYPLQDGNYKILTGHRRFFAMIYANGVNTASHFKVYRSKPVLEKTKQFQENASREDLPQYGKLRAFEDAMMEINILNDTKRKLGQKPLTVKETAHTLGISMGAFDNYNVLCRYPAVIEAYENGASISFVKMKKHVLSLEKDIAGERKTFGILIKNEINKQLETLLTDKQSFEKRQSNKEKEKGRVTSYNIGPVVGAQALKMLLTEDMTALDVGIDWKRLDWEEKAAVDKAVDALVASLNKTQ